MAKAYIQFLVKSGSLYGERIEIDTDLIPRVGELIDAHSYLNLERSEIGDFFVLSVIYKLTSEGFVAYITARQWLKGLRHQELQGRGWLTPPDLETLAHDEDDLARRETPLPGRSVGCI